MVEYTVKTSLLKDGVEIHSRELYKKDKQSVIAELLIKYVSMDMVSLDGKKYALLDTVMSFMPEMSHIFVDLYESGTLSDVFDDMVNLTPDSFQTVYNNLFGNFSATTWREVMKAIDEASDRVAFYQGLYQGCLDTGVQEMLANFFLYAWDLGLTNSYYWLRIRSIFDKVTAINPSKCCAMLNDLLDSQGCS